MYLPNFLHSCNLLRALIAADGTYVCFALVKSRSQKKHYL
jgi:hypothetical protein